MQDVQKNNPLHGVKLEALLTELVEHFGWDVLAEHININCFKQNPSIKSSLKFLRKTPWAREKVEGFYLYKYKRLPKPGNKKDEHPPRNRTKPSDQKTRSTIALKKSDKKASKTNDGKGNSDTTKSDPWAKWKNK